jgi:serine/threonine-protein kinase
MLVDFGVARWIGQSSDLTGSDMTVGTVNYAAPEQLRGEPIDGQADQYSLAATAYHMLTGTAPFANSNPAVVISQHLSATPPPISAGHPDLDRLGPVFATALAKDPADRFERCGDFAEAMRDALSPAGAAVARHRKPESATGRKRWIPAAVGAVLLAGGAGALLLGHSGAGPDVVPTTPPPPAVSARMDLPVVVIGADCAVLGAAAIDEAGSAAYCARPDSQSPDSQSPDSQSSDTVWSLQPQRLRASGSPPSATP